MASIVHLVRHGEVENPDHVVYAALEGFGLSAAGRREAAEAAEHLASRPITTIVASPLERAQETARYISQATGVGVDTDERLTEWALAGRWSGVIWEDLPERFPGELEAYLAHPADLPFSPESLDELAARVLEAVASWADDGETVFVAHQDPIQAGRLALTGRPLTDLPIAKPEHCSVITLNHTEPWTEMSYWVPPTTRAGEPFPPPATDDGRMS